MIQKLIGLSYQNVIVSAKQYRSAHSKNPDFQQK